MYVRHLKQQSGFSTASLATVHVLQRRYGYAVGANYYWSGNPIYRVLCRYRPSLTFGYFVYRFDDTPYYPNIHDIVYAINV